MNFSRLVSLLSLLFIFVCILAAPLFGPLVLVPLAAVILVALAQVFVSVQRRR